MKSFYGRTVSKDLLSHPVRGAWIEIFLLHQSVHYTVSHPVRGAWIEITWNITERRAYAKSHPVRGAWIEINDWVKIDETNMSHPVRGAWIEIINNRRHYPSTFCRIP